MAPISAAGLLETWERALGRGPADRAVALATLGLPGQTADEVARWTIGRRDRAILALRESAFGSRMEGAGDCPACAATLELKFDVADISQEAIDDLEDLEMVSAPFTLRLRPPNSIDQRAVAECKDAARARRLVFERCVIAATHDGVPIAAADLPDALIGPAADRLGEADRGADVRLSTACPECGHGWSLDFDIVAFFWREIEAWATRVLDEVHTLAFAYGWPERDILALSPTRRQFYLEAVAR
jgi:hypothetical protein